MKTKLPSHPTYPHLVSLVAMWAALTLAGCVKQQTYQPVGSTAPVPAPLAPAVIADDYVYYPAYEVYYSNRRHLYGYRQSGAWYWRPAPPHVAVNVLSSSPSVRLDFHDSPEHHHSDVVRRHPHNWKPPGPEHDDHDHHPDDEHRH